VLISAAGVVGFPWLRVRLGPLQSGQVLGTAMRSGLSALAAVAVAVLAITVLDLLLVGSGPLAFA
jgi:hypothetical protein